MTLIPISLKENNVVYINPKFVVSVGKNLRTGTTDLYMVGDETPYIVEEDVEQLIKKISSVFTCFSVVSTSESKPGGTSGVDRD